MSGVSSNMCKTLQQSDEDKLATVLANFDTKTRRAVSRSVGCKPSSWLTVLPISLHHFDLSAAEFRDSLTIRYHRSLIKAPANCDGCGEVFSLTHALDCRKGGLVIQRHNDIRDAIGMLLLFYHLPEKRRRENIVMLQNGSYRWSAARKAEARKHNTNDRKCRELDVLISNWVLGKTAACDISVTSPLNSNIMSEVGVTAGAAAQATELRKHEANDVKCSELGWLCIPLVVESYGAWGKEAMESFSSLASRLAITSSRPKSAVLSELYGRLNLNLVRANTCPIIDSCTTSPFGSRTQ
eukprot:Em0020g137a